MRRRDRDFFCIRLRVAARRRRRRARLHRVACTVCARGTQAATLADRVVLIEAGRITLDEPVHLPRQRERGSSEFAAAEKRILDRVLATQGES